MVRITQLRVETLRQGGNAQQARVTQEAIEVVANKAFAAQAKMRVTQIAIEFPFTSSPIPPGPPPPPTPTRGDVPVPPECEPAPTQECTLQPDIQVTPGLCELQGS